MYASSEAPYYPTDRQFAFLSRMDRYGWRRPSIWTALVARACVRAGWAKGYTSPPAYRITDAGRFVLQHGFARPDRRIALIGAPVDA